jgi:hypothetical protein
MIYLINRINHKEVKPSLVSNNNSHKLIKYNFNKTLYKDQQL